ncbi:DNA-binding transcriptional MerR regulator [Stackebrandtia albiflava]|uniref:DNA-binding transcriptional MerR regulator n=1 Tax=Stackebrandtia albiflava TaxID=406432 RepID=A0A562VE65_9ACTN|nr:MerR family transcriptional regulator [Stackebrandtia albiflava]TWJ16107.1 DNA-binding transcriptional MerR regulator [Stackebrandtia albiflava]
MAVELLRIGELATAAGVSPRTVDFYTRLGILTPAERTRGGFRMYDRRAVARIAAVRRLEQCGIGLGVIAASLQAGETSPTAVLAGIARDTEALESAAPTGDPATDRLIVAVLERSHHLITTAAELMGVLS